MQSFYCHSYIKNRCKKVNTDCNHMLFPINTFFNNAIHVCCLCFFHFTGSGGCTPLDKPGELSCSRYKKRFFGYQLWIFYNLFIFGFNYWYIIFRIYYPANIVYSLVPLGFNYSNFWSHSFIQTERIH